MNIPWDVIIPIIVDLIKGCIESDSELGVRNRVRRIGLAETWAIRSAIRKGTNLRGAELAQAVREVCDACSDQAKVDSVFAEAKGN